MTISENFLGRFHTGLTWEYRYYSAETCLALTQNVKHTSRKRSYCFHDAQGTRGKYSYTHENPSMIHMMCDSEKKISLCFGMFNICIFEIEKSTFFYSTEFSISSRPIHHWNPRLTARLFHMSFAW